MPLQVIMLIVFVGLGSLLFFLMYLLLPRKTVLEERLDSLAPKAEETIAEQRPPGLVMKLLGRLGASVPLRIQDYGKYQRMLIAGGIRRERILVFMGVKILLAVLLPALYLVLYGLPFEKDIMMRVVLSAALAIMGFLIPSWWLARRVKNRQLEIFHDLPDVLDLMTISVESGLSMDASMVRVCDDVYFQKSPLITEMKVSLNETRAGRPRSEALRDMGERSMEDDLKSFAAMLIQTERLGTSLAQALRVFSDSLRTLRRQRAEEAAAKIPVKLLFPLVFFIFPALLFVILGPGVIRIMKMLGEM